MNQSTLLGPVPPGSVLLAVEEPIETAHGLVNIVIKKTAARSNARAAEELTVERNALMTMGKHPFILELCGSYNDPQGNEVSTDPATHAPVTAALSNSHRVVVNRRDACRPL